MKRYPAYKDSGVEWIGEIPGSWNRKKVKHIAEVINGSTPKSGIEEYWDGDIVWITPHDLGQSNGIRISSSNKTITLSGLNSCGTTLTKPGSIILSTRAPIGHIAITAVETCTNQGCKTVVPVDSNYHNMWLFYYLHSSKSILQSLGQGSTFTELSSQNLKDFYIPFPSISEQRATVKYLDHKTRLIDALIEKKQKQIDLLQEQRTAIINHAVTKGLNPNVKMKDTGIEWLGEVPEHWEVSKLKYTAQIIRGKFSHRPRNDPALYDGPYPFIQTGDVAQSGKFIKGFSQTLNESGYNVSKEFPKGTLVMTIAANVGDIAILDFDACFPDSIVGFYPASGIDPDFLYYLLGVMKEEFYRISTINTQLNINVDRISFCKCPIPPLDEQNAIAYYLDNQAEKTGLLESSLQKVMNHLKEYRTTLISEVVTGKIDVRDEVIP